MSSQPVSNDRGRHEVFATDFQICVIELLNRTLIENQIGSSDVRREICRAFSERFGDFIDQGWFQGEQPKTYPYLCFATRTERTDSDAGSVTEIVAPETTSFLYESFSESVGWYFDEQSESLALEIEVGVC